MGKYTPIIKVAELRNITKAAEELGYTQSGLSHMIQALEDELNVKIFERDRRGVNVTKVGEDIVKIMNKIEDLENSMYETAFSYRTTMLRVGSLYSVSANWIPGILKDFYIDNSNALVNLIELKDYKDVEENVISGNLDCGFYAGSHRPHCDFLPLFKDPYYAILPLDNPLVNKKAVTLEEISKFPFIMPSEGISNSVIKELVKELHMSPNLISESLDDLATLTLVENGLGITVLPGLIATTTFRKIAIAPLVGDYHRTIGIICKSFENATDVTKSFLNSTKKWLSQSPYHN